MSFVTFGEIMLRLTPSLNTGKIRTAHGFDVNYAGSESNVASSLAVLGNEVAFITKLPKNQLGEGALSSLQSYGVDTSGIIRGGQRIGTYFIELGASIRPSSVIYDRKKSAISEIRENEFDWDALLNNKKWLFLSGITPALSRQCANETALAAQIAKKKGVKVAFDMNYRRTLWEDASEAQKIFDQILEHTDLLFGNKGALKDVYGIEINKGSISEATLEAMHIASKKFDLEAIAFTVRNQISASKNVLSAMYQTKTETFLGTEIDTEVSDRFGTGDAFAAACLHGLNLEWNPQKTLDFATAAFALKHTILGDQHTSSEAEIISVMNGNINGQVLR